MAEGEAAEERGWRWGSAVRDGVVRFLSASAISMATPDEGGCLRKWGHRYLDGRKPPQSKHQERGVRGHAEVEGYLRSGVNTLGRLAMRGYHFLPRPAVAGPDGLPDLLLEHDILNVDPDVLDEIDMIDDLIAAGSPVSDGVRPRRQALVDRALAAAPLKAAGIPVTGKIDLHHRRLENKGGEDVAQAWDPPGTYEVCDWKFVGGEHYLKAPSELPKLVQMSGYGAWIFRVYDDAVFTRLSHGYFVEKGRSQKRTIRVDREVIDRGWAAAESTSRAIQHAARATGANELDANLAACDAFGGCPHRAYCTAGRFNSLKDNLASVIGQTAAESALTGMGAPSPAALVQIRTKPASPAFTALTTYGVQANICNTATPPGESHMMSLMDQIKARQGQAAAAGVSPTAPLTVTQITGPGTIQATPALAPPVLAVTPIAPPDASVQGMLPQVQISMAPEIARLQAEEAQMRAQYQAPQAPVQAPPAAPSPGTGQISPPGFAEAVAEIEAAGRGFPHTRGEAARCYAALRGLPPSHPAVGYAGSGEIGQAGITIEHAHQVFQLVSELRAMGPAPTQPQVPQVQQIQSALPPDAPTSAPHTPAPSAIAATTALADAKPKRQRKQKPAPGGVPAAQGQAQDDSAGEDAATGLQVFVDCVPSCETADFRELLAYMHAELLKQFPCNPADIRCASKESPLAYGGADGAIAAFTKDLFAKGLAPAVAYRLDTGGDRLALAAASALAEVCQASGALFVRGTSR